LNRPPLPQPDIKMQTTKQGETGLRCLANSRSLRQAVEAANLFGLGGELIIRFKPDGTIRYMRPSPIMPDEKEAC
jgi:hypothetical protein